MRAPIQVTDEEIRSFMNFDSLLQLQQKAVQQQRSVSRMKKIFIALTGLLLIPVIYFAVNDQRREMSPAQINEEVPAELKAPSAVSDNGVTDSSKLTFNKNVQKEDPVTSDIHPKTGAEAGADRPVSTPKGPKHERARANDPVVPVYVQAEPAHGYPHLYEYFEKNLVYPTDAIKDSVSGTLTVAFIIDPTGNAVEINVENSPGRSFDREAIRLIDNMPLWKPATYNGTPVKSKISLPVTFDVRKIRNDR